MTSSEHDSLLRGLQRKYILPHAAFRRHPLGGWRVAHWMVLSKDDFMVRVNEDHEEEASRGLVIEADQLKARIFSLVAEELPLHLLTTSPLTPVITAEIQNLACSDTVAKLTCAFAHFLAFLLFRQKDALPANPDLPLDNRSNCDNANTESRAICGTPFSPSEETSARPGGPCINGGREKQAVESEHGAPQSPSFRHSNTGVVGESACRGTPGPPEELSRPASSDERTCAPGRQKKRKVSVPRPEADIMEFARFPLASESQRAACLLTLQDLFAQIFCHAKACFEGGFAVSMVLPLIALACKDGAESCLRRHYPRIFKNRWQLYSLTDKINALFAQLFDVNCYLARCVTVRSGSVRALSQTFYRSVPVLAIKVLWYGKSLSMHTHEDWSSRASSL
ncbi:hypothetical protein CSUI_003097 [Cystoisospora suis]|uniref:Uncharacterized protein n=1 Tax=Cystoisospora suis TaxID=483139 RepID=A0A2C6KG92_9APIC|nr:hypothetical protein CSUI_003097 [Cystoisospora suis]